jgi:hypothetical protein
MDFQELAEEAERILEIGEENVEALALALDQLDPDTRKELIESDFLNAWQVFYFFFRIIPTDLIRERLELMPASEVSSGVLVEEIDLYPVIFSLHKGEPCVSIGDGEQILAHFTGKEAYQAALRYIETEL